MQASIASPWELDSWTLRLSEAMREKLMTDTFVPRAAGLSQGMAYAGIEGNFLASLRWQHSGARLLAIARPSDASCLSQYLLSSP